MPEPPQILIFGAGAVGAFYGAILARSASKSTSTSSSSSTPQVSCVCRSNYPAVSKSGFALTSPTFGDWTWTPTRVFPNPDAAASSGIEWDYIVITTKALPDISDDSALIAALVSPRTAIVLIQNGLGVEPPYAARFPTTPVLSAVTIVSAAQPSPGRIAHNRWTRITIGAYVPSSSASGSSSSRDAESLATAFAALLKAGGVRDAEALPPARLQLLRWHKLAINAAMNPSSVLSGGSANGAMAADPEMAGHLLGVMREILAVAPKVCGAEMPASFASAEQILASTRKNTSGSRPSMWADWAGGKALELEVIVGAPIRAAREKGLSMPRLESMYALLSMAQQNRDRETKEKKAKL